MIIGAQMFTVHDYTKTLEGFSESLKKIADIGYKSVQVSGTCKFDPQWLKEELDKNGLTCNLTHTDITRLREETENVIADHSVYGCKYIGIGIMPDITTQNTPETWKKFADSYLPVAKKLAENGKYFMYHNHGFEFTEVDGQLATEFLAKTFPAENLGFTLDTHWVKAAGKDPAEWIKKLKGRTPCIHLKDLITLPDGKTNFAEVGKGELDFDSILKISEELGVEYAFVEQDDCYGKDPFECLKTSLEYLHAQGLC